ncbi:MAG TPA: YebC/PmpR family DNA-binding transcriptional regulator [bacterium]|nr:YebC/PmpR family DNA-binding transcriptional regulator [bacterium]
MSGHSKWATTKRKKSIIDAKRSANFTKLANTISVAARSGSDPIMNFSLRMAIDKAKSFSLPKENIERAIKRGAGELGGASLEEVMYEGFGPGKVGLMVECLTDNKNRTLNEVKLIFDKNGGALAGQGSVSWMFEKKGIIVLKNPNSQNLTEETELQIIENGADDFFFNEEEIVVYTKIADLQLVKENLEKANFEIASAGLEYVPKEKINLSEEDEEKLQKLLDALEEQNEVSEYYTNGENF